MVHALSNLVGFDIIFFLTESTLFSICLVPPAFKMQGFVVTSEFLPILSPQNQMNAMIGHTGGKHQARVVLAIQSIQPRGDAW